MSMSASAADAGEPMMVMNTPPLVDVMLVLLIMFIITIPIQTHSVKIDLPQEQVPRRKEARPDRNKIVIDAEDRIYWNAAPVDLATLAQYLELTKAITPIPELHIQSTPTAIRARRSGSCGNEARRNREHGLCRKRKVQDVLGR